MQRFGDVSMRDVPMWYCSIATGVIYTAIEIKQPVFPRATWGKGQKLTHASCSIRSESAPTYERFMIEFEDATGVQLPMRGKA